MNMDYSKAFELLNQDAEKELIKQIEKAVHDNRYNKGFRDGLAVLDKIRANIEQLKHQNTDVSGYRWWNNAIDNCLHEIDAFKAESEE